VAVSLVTVPFVW